MMIIFAFLAIGSVAATGCNPAALFCDADGNFDPTFDATVFEGSIALNQYGMFYSKKETRSDHQYSALTCGTTPRSSLLIQQVLKIDNSGLDWDQNTNVFKLYSYANTNTLSYGAQKAMYGGIIKMETCSYVINMAQVNNDVKMLITRDTISIGYDTSL